MPADIHEKICPTGITCITDHVNAHDTWLIAAAKAGNNDAFETLVRRHTQKILSMALRMTGHREDAEDVVQQSLQKAFVHLGEFEGKSSFSTWLTRIALNEGLMLLRARRRFRDVSIDAGCDTDESSAVLELPHPGPSPERTYLQAEQRKNLSVAISRLKPSIRRAIQLKELNELSVKETARALGVSFSAVKSRILRGRKRLQATIEMYDRPPRHPANAGRIRYPSRSVGNAA